MTDNWTIESLKEFQRTHGCGWIHVVAFEKDKFTIAHTDYERAQDFDLYDCPLHMFLSDCGEPPVKLGLYTAYPHKTEGWSFDPV